MLRKKECMVCKTQNSDTNKHCENCGQPLDFDRNELFHRPSNFKPIMIGICIGVIGTIIALLVFTEMNEVIVIVNGTNIATWAESQ